MSKNSSEATATATATATANTINLSEEERTDNNAEHNINSDDCDTKNADTAGVRADDDLAVKLPPSSPASSSLNKGKWTPEEFDYMLGLMEAFKAGHLPLREGTTLRSFLSSMMNCKPKRISKVCRAEINSIVRMCAAGWCKVQTYLSPIELYLLVLASS